MLGLGHHQRYYLYARSTDMRKSFDGLSGLVRNELGRNPLEGDVYIFMNARRTMVKLLQWDKNGWALYSKRLEQGSYELPQVFAGDGLGGSLKWTELLLILEGISLQSVRYRKRYSAEEKSKKAA